MTDEWHLASDMPKREDFQPTGLIQLATHDDAINVGWITLKIFFLVSHEWTYWRKITPPKMSL